jgi:hypothetical protein
MTSKGRRGRRAKAIDWAARAAFFTSVLALLGTSKPKGWTLTGTINGTHSAPPERALEVTIESSASPRLHAHDLSSYASSSADAPCPQAWPVGSKTTCLLPPGATIDGVEIEGSCGGCDSNCPPPQTAFARATAATVLAWKDVASSKTTMKLPAHAASMNATIFWVGASGARFYTAKFSVVDPKVGLLYSTGAVCTIDSQGHANTAFSVTDDIVKDKGDLEITVDVTGWGTDCKPPVAADACASPGTLKVEQLVLSK